jgi:DNA-binding Lrp family transcriptional regulator
MIALVSIFVESSRVDQVMEALSHLDNVEDTYEVTGEFDIVSVVSARDIHEFRNILKNQILKIEGVKSTVTSIVLNPHSGILH